MKKNTINIRIEQLVQHFCNGNNSAFANKIDVSEANIRNYIKGTEPKFNIIERIAESFDINYEWLLIGKGSMLKKEEKDELKEPQQTYFNRKESKVPQVITIDSNGKDNITLVPVSAAAGYLSNYDNPTYIEKLPTYTLPGMNNGIFRMFQVSGFSMLPTLHDKSYVVAQFVENWNEDIKDDRVYVVVTQEHGIVVKRLLNRIGKYGTIYCKSDNRKEYPSFTLSVEEISEIWECKMNMSFEFPNPAHIYDRLNDLEAELLHIKTELKSNKQ